MVGRRVLAAAVGAWLSVFVAAPALAAGPRAGGASAQAVQVRVSPLAVVPSSVFAALNSITSKANLASVDGSLGDASLALDVTNVNGSLGDANVYHQSDSLSTPVQVNVKAVAGALSLLQTDLNNINPTLGSVPPTLLAQVQNLENALSAQSPVLAQYFNAVNGLTQNGAFSVLPAHATFPATPTTPSSVGPLYVITPQSVGNIIQTQGLAPYSAIASDGDATAQHTVAADSSVDALNVLNLPAIPLSLSAVVAQLNSIISTLEAALAPAASAAGVTLPAPTAITGPVSSTLSTALGTLQGTVGTVSSTVNSVVPAGTPVSQLTGLLTSLLSLAGALNAMPSSIDLSNVVATKDVASHVTTTVTNGLVDSIATTKAADVSLLTINSPQLTQALGVAQGQALAEIIGATATAEAKADGRTSTATGSGQFTDIKLLPGSSLWSQIPNSNGGEIKFSDLIGNSFTKDVGPLRVQILTGACACIDQAHGGTADAASAQVAALEIKLSYIGDPNLLLGTTAVQALTSPTGNAIPLADVQLANVTANAGNQVHVLSAETGSPYGVGLLVGFLMLIGALGMGLTYRRFAAVKVRS